MDKILVTGASGFIGRALCNALLEKGYHVRGTLRSKNSAVKLPPSVEAKVIGSIDSHTAWDDALAGIDIVIHLAARVHVMEDFSTDPLSEFGEINTAGTKRLASAAKRSSVRRFIYLSSVGVNGKCTTGKPFSENSPAAPYDAYTISKWEAEKALKKIDEEKGMEIVILRPPLVYGPGAPGNFGRLIRLITSGIPLPFGSIKNQRSFIYVKNLVDAISTCISNPYAAGEVFLVSDSRDISTPELITMIALTMEKKAHLIAAPNTLLRMIGGIMGKRSDISRLTDSLCIDSSKIRGILAWYPPFTMESGICETVRWYTVNRSHA